MKTIKLIKTLFSSLTVVLVLCTMNTASGQVSGTVFIDINANGVQDLTASFTEPGYANLDVIGYGADGTVYGPVVTSGDGTYTLGGVNQPTRVEFSWTESWLHPGISGGTTLQFVAGASSDVNLPLSYGRCYADDTPEHIVPCYINGDPLAAGSTAGTMEVLVKFDDEARGINGDTHSATVLATGAQIGSVYGVAVKRETGDIFTSAFMKRHCGFGPDGSGAIYRLNESTGTISTFIDFSDYSISTGIIADNASRGLVLDPTQPSTDIDAYSLVFKMSFGDLEISDDESHLYVANLHDRRIYKISIDDINNNTLGYIPEALPIPNLSCNNGVARPFGLSYYKGQIYAGYTCTGENGGSTSDLQAEVYKFNEITSLWESVLNIPLDYDKGAIKRTLKLDNQPWSDDPNDLVIGMWNMSENYTQAVLADIEFDYEGSMHIGLRDRTGDMIGFNNSDLSGTPNTNWLANVSGDIMRTYWDGSAFVLESNGSAGPYTSAGVGNDYIGEGGPDTDQGPGGGEFYHDEYWLEGALFVHSEISLGSFSMICGKNEILTTVYDPIDNRYFAGGMHWYDITTGAGRDQNFEIFNSVSDGGATLGKANGLGDLELLSDPAPVELGNRVWNDINGDGIQDAGEPGIASVDVELFDPTTSTVIAVATTDSNGNYIFSTATGTTTSSFIYGLILNYGESYELRIVGAEGSSQQTALSTLENTDANSDASSNGDARDSDGTDAETSVITFTLGAAGENNHTYDFGFSTAATDECSCKEYIYLNSPSNGHIEKFSVTPAGEPNAGELVMIDDGAGNSWYSGSGLPNPHGLSSDLNGNLYVGENNSSGDIRRISCDGNLVDESEWVFNSGGQFNVHSIDNTLYFNNNLSDGNKWFEGDIMAVDLCTQEVIGSVEFCEADVTYDWGFYIDPRTKRMYATHGGTDNIPKYFWTFTEDDFDTDVTTCISATPLDNYPTDIRPMRGITTDLDGNVYISRSGRNVNNYIIKYGPYPTFNYIGQSDTDDSENGTGWAQMIGIVYSETTNLLYTSSTSAIDDCVSVFDLDLNNIASLSVPQPVNNAGGKAIAILKECCPSPIAQVVDEVVCSNGGGERLFLQEFSGCGEGIVCEGQWTETANTSGGEIVFNDCDLSITVNGSGCATYTLEKTTAASGSQQCGPFSVTVNICTEVPTATLTPSVGTCTASNPNNDATIDITAVMNADAANFSTGATYTGPAYGGAGEVDISSGSGSITGLMHNTQYTVRVWNGADDCFVDERVMTPSIDCDSCPDLTCSSIFVSGTEISGTPLTTAGPNLISNPSFESEPLNFNTYVDLPDFQADIDTVDMVDWTTFNTVFPPGRIVDESISGFPPGYYDVQEGEYAFIGFSWDNASQITGVRQDIQVESGVEYCASFYMAPGGKFNTTSNAWMEYPLSGEGHGWGVTLSGAASYNQDYLADTDDFNSGNTINPIEWTLHEFSFVATSTGTVTVEFAMLEIAGRKAIYLDNVSITACGSAEPCASPGCDPVPSYEVCSDGSNNVTLSCDNANVNTIIWYDSNGVQVGTSCDLILGNSDIGDGTAGQTECFYYEALDANGCDLISCCPVTVTVISCGVFDLALQKVLASTPAGPYAPGDAVSFDVTIYNQGDFDAFDIDVADYFDASELTFDDLTVPATTAINGAAVSVVGTGPSFELEQLAAGDQVTVTYNFTIASDFTGTSIINNAEIIDAADEDNGPTAEDEDSPLTAINDGTTNELLTDNDINDDSTGGIDNPLDEDDYDPAEVPVTQIFDLALTKVVDTGATPGPYNPGDPVTFTIDVFNQGTLDATGIVVEDYIPTGMTYASGDFMLVGSSYQASIPSLVAGASQTLSITLTIDPSFQGTLITNNAEIVNGSNALGIADQDDDLVDQDGVSDDTSELDTNNDVDDEAPGTPGTQDNIADIDDYDPEQIQVVQIFDLALEKILSAATPGPFVPGDEVTFTIEVTNQGTLDAYNIELKDYYIPAELVLADDDWTILSSGVAEHNNDINFIGAGEQESVNITFTIAEDFQGESIVNYGEISQADNDNNPSNDFPTDADSTPDDNQGDDELADDGEIVDSDNGNLQDDDADSDDYDPAPITVVQEFDLAIQKTYTSWDDTNMDGLISNGEDVTFTVVVYNQGTLDATGVEVTDYVPTGLTHPSGATVLTTVGAIAKGASATYDIVMTVDPAFMGGMITNNAEITAGTNALALEDEDNPLGVIQGSADDDSEVDTDNDTDDEAPGTPGTVDNASDVDDYDPAQIMVGQVFDLAIDKLVNTTATPGPYAPGDEVMFTITVYNQGSVDATAITVEDYIPTGMSFVSSADFSLVGAEYLASIPTLASGASTTLGIRLSIDNNFMGTDLTNNVEIIGASNALGLIDQDNDLAVEQGSSDDESELDTDNDVDDEYPGTPGTADNPLDVDDYDPAQIVVDQTFDLALVKTLSTGTVVTPGDDVTFNIEVFNQGTVDAYNIFVKDYFPSDLILNDAGWTETSTGVATLNNDIDFIAEGESAVVSITFTVDADFQGTSIINDAEISAADNDDDPTNTPLDDEDSTPDDNDFPNDPNDDDTSLTDGSDDQDPAEVVVTQEFDLALDKLFTSWDDTDLDGTIDPGEDVTFTITVYNQGTLDATGVEVTDYVSGDMIFTAGDNPLWTGGSATAPTISVGNLEAGAQTSVTIVLEVDPGFMGESIINNAEITAGDNALDLVDEDSDLGTVDGSSDDESELDTDNDIDDEAPGTPGTFDNVNDVDDYDPAEITIGQRFDLALIKTFSSSSATPIVPGTDVTFDLTVYNQGTLDAYRVNVNDYIPTGLVLNDANWTEVAGVADLNSPIAFIAAGDDVTVSITFTVDASFMGTSITNNAEISEADDDTDPTNTPPTDVDSTPDNEDGTTPDPNNDDVDDTNGNDDYDPETIVVEQIFDLALTKTFGSSSVTPIVPGSTVTFNLTVYNQGTLDAYNVGLTDYVPVGLVLADTDWSMSGGNAILNNEIPYIAVGDNVVVPITFTVDASFMGTSIVNDSEISGAEDVDGNTPTDVDSTPGDDLTPDDLTNNDDTADTGGGDDQDPEEITIVQTFDLALQKTYTSWDDTNMDGLVSNGEEVTFTVVVYNQGTIDATGVAVTDYVPSGMIHPSGSTVVTTVGNVPAGGSESYTIVMTVSPSFMSGMLTNNAEITSAANALGLEDEDNPLGVVHGSIDDESEVGTDNDIDDEASGTPGTADNPDDVDDYDPAQINVGQVFDLAIDKVVNTVATPGPYAPGDEVMYTVTVYNQGSLDATVITVEDYIPAGMSFVSSSDFSLVGAEYLATIPTLASGASTTLGIRLSINNDFMGSDLTNNVEIIGAANALGLMDQDNDLAVEHGSSDDESELDTDNDIDDEYPGTPGTSDNPLDVDDYDPAQIEVEQTFDLALEKTLSTSGTITPGEPVTFNIAVTNQGTVDAYNVFVVDYFPSDLTLNDTDWTQTSAGSAIIDNEIPFIAVGETVSVDVSFIVNVDFQGTQLINWAEISEADDNDDPNDGFPTDVDSTPDGDQFNSPGETDDLDDDGVIDEDGNNGGDEDDHDPALVTITQEFDLALQKTYTSWTDTNMDGLISIGEDVTFTVEVFNQGTVDATGVEVTDYVPTGLLHPSGSTVVTTIGNIAKGSSESYVIVMTVDPTFMGGMLTNNTEITAGTNVLGLEDEDNPLGVIHGSADDESELDTDNDIDDEAPGTPGLADNPDDVDDYDPAPLMIGQVFDLAIDKVIDAVATPAPYFPNSLVTFDVTVYNQGTIDATDLIIEDYLPSGTSFESSPDFTLQGAEYLANIATLAAGASTTLEITIRIDDDFMGSSLVNNVEIVSAQNALGLVDQDDDLASEDGSVDDASELDTDNDVDDEAPGTPGTVDNPDDVDDYDPALVPVTQIFDLALEKIFNSSSETPIRPGSEVTFTLEVTNQGTLDAYNINLVDYIPAGLTLNDIDWTESNPGVAYLNNDIIYIARGEMESVNITFTVDEDFMGTEIINWAEINQADDNNDPTDGFPTDVDSTPNDDQFSEDGETDDLDDDGVIDEDGTNGGDEDDHDPALIEITQSFDLALEKVFTSWDDTDMNGMIDQGENVTFTVTVYNQGNLDATDVIVTDYVPTGMLFNAVDNSDFSGGALTPTASIDDLPMGGQVDLTIVLQVDPMFMGMQAINNAEITSADNALGQEDDDNPLSVIHGMQDDGSELATDNDTDDEFPGTPGIEDNPDDVDDYDPAMIVIGQVFDLALFKVYDSYNDLSGDGVLSPGDEVTFLITVVNQGSLDAYNIQISDYIPEGLSLIDPQWNNMQNVTIGQLNAVHPFLAAGGQTTRTITFAIDELWRGESIVNWAEISAADDNDDPSDGFPEDEDSTPNSIQGDDNFGGDNIIDNSNNDEDDHDPAEINPVIVLDLALAKKDQSDDPVSEYGEVRTFDIEVTNQGTILATEFTVVDYIPCGFEFVSTPGSNPGWTYNSTTRIAEFIYDEDILYPNDIATLEIQLAAVYCDGDVLFNWTNYAEISDYDDDFNDFNQDIQDIDSDPDATNFDDPGGQAWTPTDDHIDGDGTGAIGSNDPATDEDDHDPERVEIFDLALIKTISDATPGPYSYYDLITFDIEVFNQGNIGAQNVEVTDYIPEGYGYDASLNPLWTGTYPNVSTTITNTIPVGGSEVVSITLQIIQTDGGEKDWINYAEITASENENGEDRTDWDVDSNSGSNNSTENGVEPDDAEDNDIDSRDKGGEEDDHDPAGIEVYDLAQRKTTEAIAPFRYGDDITYTIEVFNQGSIESSNIEITDYIPCGFEYLASNDSNGWSYDLTTGNATIVLADALVPGESVTVDLTLRLQQCLDMDDLTFTNFTEISDSESNDPDEDPDDIDSDEDEDPENDGEPMDDEITGDPNDPDNPDEDDHDPEEIDVFDLALIKELVTEGPYSYGDLLEFKLTVCNQGNMTAANIVVEDYLPIGYTFDFADNPGWGGTIDDPTYTISGVLNEDICTDFSMFVTIVMTDGGEKDWINYAEIIEATDEDGNPVTDADSNPGSNGPEENEVEPGDDADDDLESTDQGGEEDDHDPAGIEVYDLAQRKTTDATAPFRYGDDITYTIEVFNQGSIESSNIEITDYIPCGFEYLASNDSNGWSYDLTTGNATIVLADALVPGESVTVDLTLRLQQCLDMDDLTFTNFTEISDSESNDPDEDPDDIDSDEDDDPGNDGDPTDDEITGDPNDPDNPDEDDHDPEEIDVFDLALIKELVTEGPYAYGDLIEFDITVCNQGNMTAANIVVEDYLPVGYSFDFGDNPEWGGTVDDPTYEIEGTLAEDACVTFKLFATIEMTDGGEKDWINYAEIIEATDENGNPVTDADSNPGSDGSGENAVEPGDDADDDLESTDIGGEEDDHDPAGIEVYDLAQVKFTMGAAPYKYGDVVSYTVMIYNQGSIAATEIEITDYIPLGLQYVVENDANGWSYDDDTRQATVTLPGVLEAGGETSIMISLRIQESYEDVANSWTNFTEISDSESNDPDEAADDIDSTPDNDPDNDGPTTDMEINGDGNCSDCIQTVIVPLAGATPPIVTEVFVDGMVLVLPNYPYDLTDPAQGAQFLADCLALGYNVTESLDPITQVLTINVLYPGQNFDSFNINGGEEYYFTCSECNSGGPDEDDHDPDVIDVFDLAIRKFIENKGPYGPGEIAEYIIDVFNQGNVDAYSIEVTDYINEGYAFDPSINPGWNYDVMNPELLVYTIDGPVLPGDSVRLMLSLEVIVPDGANIHSWYNEAEISGGDDDTDPTNEGPVDADSYPDQDPDNDNDLVDGPDDDPIFDEEDDNDNVIDEHIDDPFNDGDDDEDDNDAADILVVGGLGDTVWKDIDGDGIQDENEPGVEDVIVTLTDCEGNVLATETTDADGFYFFNNLIPGDYQVSFDISNLPEGCAFTQQDIGNDDTIDSDVDLNGLAPCTNIQGGEYDSTFDAGLLILVNIGDFVWHDLDGDGIQDAGEPGIEGVFVYLFDGDNNLVEMTMTDEDGYYLFENIYPDTYYIAFGDPDGFEVTFPNTTADDMDSDITNFILSPYGSTTDLFTIEYGQEDDLTFDAGYYMCVPIGELVWYDLDEDDIHDSTENGINGLEVNLYRLEDGGYVLYETQVTGHKPGTPSDDGYYKFCAPPGTYYVEVAMPPLGLVLAQANALNNLALTDANESIVDSDMTNEFGNSTTTSFKVLSGEVLCNIGTGFYPMATLGNRVWFDDNQNGLQDDGEDAVEGVKVEAIAESTGEVINESTTNTEGIYKLDYLRKESYYLRVTPPSGYGFTQPNTGDDEIDSDVDHTNGANTTRTFSMKPGDEIMSVDAGIAFGVLPLTWIDVRAERLISDNLVSWITADEINVSHFIVERAFNQSLEFAEIGRVEANNELGENKYSLVDDQAENSGTYYYRIKQVDIDGRNGYSKMVYVIVENDINRMSVSPNPAVDNAKLSIDLATGEEADIAIFDRTGKLIRTYTLANKSEGYSTSLEISDLPSGVYTIRLIQGELEMNSKLIIVK